MVHQQKETVSSSYRIKGWLFLCPGGQGGKNEKIPEIERCESRNSIKEGKKSRWRKSGNTKICTGIGVIMQAISVNILYFVKVKFVRKYKYVLLKFNRFFFLLLTFVIYVGIPVLYLTSCIYMYDLQQGMH